MTDPRVELAYWKLHINGLIVRQYQKYLKGKVADFGCGEGWMSWILAELPRVKTVSAFDVNGAKMPMSSDKVTFVVADLERLRITAKFDSAICFHALEHLRRPFLAIEKIRQSLKTNSHLIVSVPNEQAYANPDHITFFSEDSLKQIMLNAGFKLVECYIDTRTDGHGNTHNCITGLFKI